MTSMAVVRFLILFLLMSVAALAVPDSASIRVIDNTGQTLTLKEHPRRIISLSPHAAELLFAAGGGQWLIATPPYTDYPEAAKAVPHIGGHNNFSVESIVALKPDLILFWPGGNSKTLEQQLRAFGLPIYYSKAHSIEEIASELRNLGVLVGSERGAKEADRLLAAWQQLEQQYSHRTAVPIFLEVASEPLMTLNGEHMVSRLFTLCGAHNIFADAPVLVPRISRETVVARAPAIIVEGDSGDRIGSDQLYQEWQSFNTIPAVRNKMVFTFDGGHILRPTPRILLGAKALCEKVDQARTLMGQKGLK